MHILDHEANPENGVVSRKLSGKSFLLTQPESGSGELSKTLELNDAQVIRCPMIRIVSTQASMGLGLLSSIDSSFDWIIFTSKNAVRFFFEQLEASKVTAAKIRSCKICAVGPQTAELLAAYGISTDLIPRHYTAEGIVEAFATQNKKSLRILYPKGDKARNVINENLAANGHKVYSPVLYRTLPPDDLPKQARKALRKKQVDCAIFTAPSMVENLAKILGDDLFKKTLTSVLIASIGPITSQACHRYGLNVDIEANPHTLASLAEEILRRSSLFE
jgi:uroporphyrinogen III methyltransferase/synthase